MTRILTLFAFLLISANISYADSQLAKDFTANKLRGKIGKLYFKTNLDKVLCGTIGALGISFTSQGRKSPSPAQLRSECSKDSNECLDKLSAAFDGKEFAAKLARKLKSKHPNKFNTCTASEEQIDTCIADMASATDGISVKLVCTAAADAIIHPKPNDDKPASKTVPSCDVIDQLCPGVFFTKK